MTRFLLTLLALISGLTVSGGSADARICGVGGEQIGLTEVSAQESRAVVHVASVAPVLLRPVVGESRGHAMVLAEPAQVATVRLRADRARE